MGEYKYITEYTDETTIQTLKLHGALSVRSANVLIRAGKFENIGQIKHLKPEVIARLRNAGNHTIDEIMEFIRVYKSKRAEIEEQKKHISVGDFIAYCKKCGDVAQG